MIKDKKTIIAQIAAIANRLDIKYSSETNFRNHCYLRIAYDCALKNKWDVVVPKPFVKNADVAQLAEVFELLNHYLTNKNQLMLDNIASLNFRKLARLSKEKESQTLF